MARRIGTLVVTAIVALTAVAGALAAGDGKVLYRFVGQMQAAPAGTSLQLSVIAGNPHALRAMLGQAQEQTFATDGSTQFLRWTNGVPTVVTIGNVVQGDYVTVNVRAPRATPLATLLQTPARLVADRGQTLANPGKPLYLFRGTIASSTNGAVSVNLTGGNRRALRLLVGQGSTQTFASDGETIFLHWEGLTPTVIDSSRLTVGDRVVVRIRAAGGDSLQQVLSTPANHVAEREPAEKEAQQSAQS